MASPLDTLNELRDRLAGLPAEVAEAVRMDLTTPGQSPEARALPALTADAVSDLLGGQAPGPGPETQPFDLPSPSAPQAGDFDTAAAEPPGPPEPFDLPAPTPPGPGAFDSPQTPQTPGGPADVGAGEGTPSPPEPAYDLTGQEDGGQAEVLSLLQEVAAGVAALGGGGQGGPAAGRPLPERGRVPWRGAFQPQPEGYGGGAAPSMPYSNLAGTGGASSRLGYGQHQGGGRYWQPESDDEAPR